jgi:hypothetical protein
MYRIKLASGQERVYQSIDELTGAVQSGEVNGEALIYHQRADRWLSVANHQHYQIATSRAAAQKPQPASDGSRRQVVNAVRPSAAVKVDPNLPPTVPRAQLIDAVVEIDRKHELPPAPAKRVSIPNLKKPEEKPTLSGFENQVNGVMPAHGSVAKPQQTSVLPQRHAPAAPVAPAKPEAPKVPDLDFDLLEPEFEDLPPKPAPKADAPTPQVDKLLSLLEPAGSAAPRAPAEPRHHAGPVVPVRNEIEFLDLSDHVNELGSPPPIPDRAHHVPTHPHHHPHVAKKSGGKGMLIGIAAMLILGVGGFLWKPWSANSANQPTQTLAATPAPRTDAFGGTSSVDTAAQPVTTAAPAKDSAATTRRDSTPSIVQVAAPRISMKAPLPNGLTALSMNTPAATQIPAATLIQHYATAYADARGEMELRMLQIGFTQLFLKNRLASSNGIQDTRRLIAGASGALRQYRSQEQRIERAYQDTVGTNGRALGWSPRDLGTWNTRSSSKESPETARLTNLMLSQIDAVFALLQEQEGKFTVSGETIVFETSDAARQYGTLRAWINQQADNHAGTGDAALPATLRQVIKGIGTTRLPQERSR